MRYDTIIVGAGTAGCVLATRLSEDPHRSVLLLEAGPDYAEEADLPPEIRSGLSVAFTHDWGFSSEPDPLGRSIRLLRGKLVGGCSATNAAAFVRGAPSDYDEWAAQGNPGWAFSEVLPFFRRVERDLDFDDDWHGQDGYVPVRRDRSETLVPEQAAFLEACAVRGHARVADHNAPDAVGAGIWPKNLVAGVRQSAALTYLAAARTRSNLTIRSGVLVEGVVFEGRRAIGVRLAGSGEVIRADTTILSAGAFCSPAILMRSGLGPAEHLEPLGIRVVHDLPGVGDNLMDHPVFGLQFTTSTAVASQNRPLFQCLLTVRSPSADASHDLHIYPRTIVAAEPGERPTFSMFVGLMKPRSLGRLRLGASDAAAAPIIDLGYFTNPDDLSRMLHGVREARDLAATPPLSGFALQEVLPGPEAADDDVELGAVIRAHCSSYFHPVGTCRMGPPSDGTSVVDAKGRVHGVEGLSVVDASIMPSIPAANTNLPVFMLAERCAAWLAEER